MLGQSQMSPFPDKSGTPPQVAFGLQGLAVFLLAWLEARSKGHMSAIVPRLLCVLQSRHIEQNQHKAKRKNMFKLRFACPC